MSEYYQDKSGDLWVLISDQTIKRLRDGNLGGFWGGRNLMRVSAPPLEKIKELLS